MSAPAFAPEIVRPGWEYRREGDSIPGLFTKLRRNLLLAISLLLLCVLGSAAAAFLLPSYWRAEIELLPVTRPMSGPGSLAGGLSAAGGNAGLLSLLFASSSTEDEALAVLRSRELFDSYATANNLLPILFADKWDADKKTWTVTGSDIPTLRRAYRLFDRSIREVDLDRRSGIVTVGITWKDRQLAAKWAREFVDLTNQKLRESAIAEAKSNMSYLTREMRNVRDVSAQQALVVALASAYEREVQEYIFAQGQKDFAFRIIDPPTVPDIRERVFPQRTLFVAFGFAAGLVLAFAAIQLREWGRRPAQQIALQAEVRS